MFVVHALSEKGPRPARSNTHSILDAIRAGVVMKDAGYQNITITDLRDGKPMPLEWWQTVAAGVKVG